MATLCKRLFTEYGMVLVLLLLGVFFSVATISEQSPVGEVAAKGVATEIAALPGDSLRIFIAVGNEPDDAVFALSLIHI